MGWSQSSWPSPSALLYTLTVAVDRYLAAPTTGNLELLREARARVEIARSGW